VHLLDPELLSFFLPFARYGWLRCGVCTYCVRHMVLVNTALSPTLSSFSVSHPLNITFWGIVERYFILVFLLLSCPFYPSGFDATLV